MKVSFYQFSNKKRQDCNFSFLYKNKTSLFACEVGRLYTLQNNAHFLFFVNTKAFCLNAGICHFQETSITLVWKQICPSMGFTTLKLMPFWAFCQASLIEVTKSSELLCGSVTRPQREVSIQHQHHLLKCLKILGFINISISWKNRVIVSIFNWLRMNHYIPNGQARSWHKEQMFTFFRRDPDLSKNILRFVSWIRHIFFPKAIAAMWEHTSGSQTF